MHHRGGQGIEFIQDEQSTGVSWGMQEASFDYHQIRGFFVSGERWCVAACAQVYPTPLPSPPINYSQAHPTSSSATRSADYLFIYFADL